MSTSNSTSNAASTATGPRTPEGKAISSQNARKHGLTSAAPHVPAEERPDFDAFEAALRLELLPANTTQEIAFRQILANAWNLERITRFELAATDLNEILKLQRYRTSAERGYQRALNELRKQQTDTVLMLHYRNLRVDMPPLADPGILAKRTHAKAGATLADQWLTREEKAAIDEKRAFEAQWRSLKNPA